MSLRVQATTDLTGVEPGKQVAVIQRPRAAALFEEEQVAKSDKEQQPIREADVKSAVESINGAIEHVSRGLRFSVHEDTQRLMVKVVNVVTQEVIKEIPPEDVLDTAARIREMIGLLIDERA